MSTMQCCLELSESKARSPFQRVIALDYYDGPLSGAAKCSICSRCYRFECIAWSPDEDIRVYSLHPLPEDVFDIVIGLLHTLGTPHWPVWFPVWSIQGPKSATLARKLNFLLTSAIAPIVVIVAKRIEKEIYCSRTLVKRDQEILNELSHIDGPVSSGASKWLAKLQVGPLVPYKRSRGLSEDS